VTASQLLLRRSSFHSATAALGLRGGAECSLKTPEFAAWIAARAETDAAWGRWAQVMDVSVELRQRDS
jgi:hypothetical protein